MKRVAEVIQLRPEQETAYRQLHAHPWSEVLATLKAAGISNYSIFLRDGLLFSYLEYTGDDYEKDIELIAADPVTRRWWSLCGPCQRPVGSAQDGQWWAPAEELFHLD
jgi:L-rhamnose mutarotase